jgi:hypothetical protein
MFNILLIYILQVALTSVMLDHKERPQYTKCSVAINGVTVLNMHDGQCHIFKMDLLDFVIQTYNIPDLSHVDFLAYLLLAGSILQVLCCLRKFYFFGDILNEFYVEDHSEKNWWTFESLKGIFLFASYYFIFPNTFVLNNFEFSLIQTHIIFSFFFLFFLLFFAFFFLFFFLQELHLRSGVQTKPAESITSS